MPAFAWFTIVTIAGGLGSTIYPGAVTLGSLNEKGSAFLRHSMKMLTELFKIHKTMSGRLVDVCRVLRQGVAVSFIVFGYTQDLYLFESAFLAAALPHRLCEALDRVLPEVLFTGLYRHVLTHFHPNEC